MTTQEIRIIYKTIKADLERACLNAGVYQFKEVIDEENTCYAVIKDGDEEYDIRLLIKFQEQKHYPYATYYDKPVVVVGFNKTKTFKKLNYDKIVKEAISQGEEELLINKYEKQKRQESDKVQAQIDKIKMDFNINDDSGVVFTGHSDGIDVRFEDLTFDQVETIISLLKPSGILKDINANE